MAIEVFPFNDLTADWGLQDSVEANIEEHELGDGYVLRRPKGINHLRESWSPKFSFLTKQESQDMYAWIKPRLNLTPFMWKHPDTKEMRQVVCKSISRVTTDIDIYVIQLELVEDFNV